jgi:hypothetical protein
MIEPIRPNSLNLFWGNSGRQYELDAIESYWEKGLFIG